jgi:hypothetical protein
MDQLMSAFVAALLSAAAQGLPPPLPLPPRPPIVARGDDAMASYMVPLYLGNGVPIRIGPGINYPQLGTLPAGTVLHGKPPLQCRPREDGRYGADYCHIAWRNFDGWVSSAGLVQIQGD